MADIAKLKCPFCGAVQDIGIPEGKCLALHICKKCGKLIATPKGVCCVICAYSDKKCEVSVK